MADEIVNKVASSGIVTVDLEELYPNGERVLFDIKPLLFQELILKEKDFREFIKNHDWSVYENKYVAITCTADAIVPTWAYMLISLALEPYAKKIVFGDLQQLETVIFQDLIDHLELNTYEDKRIVIKGCSKLPIPMHAYVLLSAKLKPVAKSIMFGEPCSTVPLYKKASK
jgi:hypothetical protein